MQNFIDYSYLFEQMKVKLVSLFLFAQHGLKKCLFIYYKEKRKMYVKLQVKTKAI